MPDGRFNLFESVSDKFLPVSWGVALVSAVVLGGFFFAMLQLVIKKHRENDRVLYLVSTLFGAFSFLAWFIFGIKQYQAAPSQGLETSFVDLIFLVVLGLLYGAVIGSITFAFLVAATMLYEFVIADVRRQRRYPCQETETPMK